MPLHPIVVHLPIVMMLLLPFVIAVLIVAEKKGIIHEKLWYAVAFYQAIVTGASFLALKLGERDEELVEKFVSEKIIENHEEWGEMLAWTALAIFIMILGSIVLKKIKMMKVMTLVASIGGLLPVVMAGHTGGELVYRHGAAQAHVQKAENQMGPTQNKNEKAGDIDDDDD